MYPGGSMSYLALRGVRNIFQIKEQRNVVTLQHGNICLIINNYWMRLSMILWNIKTEVCVICRSRRLRQITQTRGFYNSWYHAKTEFNNCFIIQFSHNSSSETEAKRSAILFLRRTLRGLVTWQTLNLTWSMQYLQQILHLSCQVHKLLWIDWMLWTNQIFHSESDLE